LRAGATAQGFADVNRLMGSKRLVASVKVELALAEDVQLLESASKLDCHFPTKEKNQHVRIRKSVETIDLPNGCSLKLPPGTSPVFIDHLIGGVTSSLSVGPLMACALNNVSVNIVSYDIPDSNSTMAPASLHIAASQAVSNALHNARHLQDELLSDLILLEPIMRVVISAPQSALGDVLSDIGSRRRGVIVEVTSSDTVPHLPNFFENACVETQVTADVPIANLIGYASILRSITGGRATFSATFLKYDVVPDEESQRILGFSKR
jgi:elongation factor G